MVSRLLRRVLLLALLVGGPAAGHMGQPARDEVVELGYPTSIAVASSQSAHAIERVPPRPFIRTFLPPSATKSRALQRAVYVDRVYLRNRRLQI
jgi:hypothetical protein